MSRKLASRSTHGCWTCRLRKKKCDENHPSCFRCTSLQLACDGYGPRPYWMDRGDLQREQARYKTQIIAQIKAGMRESELPGTSHNVEHGLETLVSGTIATSNHPPARPAQEPLLQSGPVHQCNLQPPGTDGDLHTSSEPIWSEALNNADFSTELFCNQTIRMSSYNQSSSDTSQTLAASISPVTEDNYVRGSIDVSRSNSSSEASLDSMDLLCNPILSEYCSSELSEYSSEADWSFCARRTSRSGSTDLVSQPAGLSNSILHGDVDDILFMYYFDHVFYMHCPFYFPSNRQGRGWLLSILKRVNSAYHAALALSEYHHSTSTQHGSAYPVRTGAGHYDLALQELQTSLPRSSAWTGNLDLTHSVEVLTTILHLLFYESCSGGKHNWQIHLGGANALLQSLVQAQMGSAIARKDQTKEQQDRAIPHPDTSITFLLGFFVHMHIVTCASTRSSQFLISDHKVLLETGEVNLADLIGCSNWVMIAIFEISSLDKWKKEEEDAHRLSLIELTKRARQIEERLLSRLASIELDLSKRASVDTHLRPEFIKTEITRIFALSAITYLHVVISGPYPDIPDIKRSVSKTIDALRSLPDPKLLQHVVWPYCISGCLAADEQQKVFRELVSLPRITHGTCLEALGLMEECWRLRKSESSNHDWASIMKRRGQYILLI
ncbi:fungal-specific transcription factor domain-containing protein [Aspergillus caelatus]|uniref:Fungal-specific transcription factor domain-containing protein n=1 Tax=Aspergillus caelatus TaxID=61420 RepID=A0A5N7A369_9EURO|nr:fungal-specific transcription factor domain-containing protein [Aspergillus caelatus]KAE8364013.1 fungal-specific transcription factor domain-containing protein [Aspergillus caelatus]